MTRLRHALAASLLVALALPSALLVTSAAATETPTGSPSPTETTSAPTETTTPTTTPTTTAPASPSATPTTTGPFTVDDAQLRWGVNDESNNKAFAPGTYNFFSAGELNDPGEGGKTLPATGSGATWSNGRASGWAAQSGQVRIEKLQPDGSYALADFAGTSRTVAGTTMSGTTGPFSGHQVVIDGGTGTVDPVQGTATVSWKGTFTVAYYSGMTFFMVADPELRVTPTSTQLWGTVSGYASDMDDLSKWTKVPGTQVVLADLPGGTPLPTAGGFSFTPAYQGVTYDAPADGVTQVRSGSTWGAFPTSFLTAMQRLGSGAYWYSSGGSADAHKVAKAVTVSYSAGDPVQVPADPKPTKKPTKSPTKSPTKAPSVAPTPPTATPTPTASSVVRPTGPALPTQVAAVVPPAAAPVAAAQDFDPRLPAIPVVSARTAPVSSEATSPGHPWEWWSGSVLLLGAVVISIISIISSRVKGKS